MSELLVVRDFGGVPEVLPSAFELRDDALKLASKVRNVTTDEEQTAAVKALRALKSIRTGMETTRKAVKSPVLDLGKRIDAIAAEFLTDCDKQEGRLQGLINYFQRKQLDEQRKEQERLQREADEAERLRVAAAKETDPQKKTELEGQAFEKQMEQEVAQVPVVAKPKGLVVRERVNFKITDAILFCQAYPNFFKWHAENEYLKLDRMRVLDELNREDGKGIFHRAHFGEELSRDVARPELVRPPGMEIFSETRAHVR
jgi:hypothetical protein